MVITTWKDYEIDVISRFMKNKNFKIVINEPNHLNYGADNYILIAQKT